MVLKTAMGFVCRSRGLGLMAHGFETKLCNERLKAAMPSDLIYQHMTYSGPFPRKLLEWKTGKGDKSDKSIES